MDDTQLRTALDRAFDASDAERRVVARQARDLAESGRLEADRGGPLTVDALVGELQEAPAGSTLAERWNWWVGALDIAYGGYGEFPVRVVDDEHHR